MILKHVPFVRVLAVSAPLLMATSLIAQDGEGEPVIADPDHRRIGLNTRLGQALVALGAPL